MLYRWRFHILIIDIIKTVYPIDIYDNGVAILNVPTAEVFEERQKKKRTKQQKRHSHTDYTVI